MQQPKLTNSQLFGAARLLAARYELADDAEKPACLRRAARAAAAEAAAQAAAAQEAADVAAREAARVESLAPRSAQLDDDAMPPLETPPPEEERPWRSAS